MGLGRLYFLNTLIPSNNKDPHHQEINPNYISSSLEAPFISGN